MPLPELTLGLIVRYEYLWSRRVGSPDAADKDRPACVVATFDGGTDGETFVVYLPISHTPPSEDQDGIELSEHAKSTAGLDVAKQWVLVSECNIDLWPYGVRQLPNRSGRFHHGHLPPSVFKAIRDRFVTRYRDGRVRQIGRAGT